MHRYKELEVWKRAVELSYKVYHLTNRFPSDEKFGLISQMRRSAVSIASNIAEGAGRNSNGEFNQFLGIAQGSAFELETQCIIAGKMQLLEITDFQSIEKEIVAITNMIYKLKQSIS